MQPNAEINGSFDLSKATTTVPSKHLEFLHRVRPCIPPRNKEGGTWQPKSNDEPRRPKTV
jgi:hypothetical protein